MANLTANVPLSNNTLAAAVAIVDGAGNQVTSFGGGGGSVTLGAGENHVGEVGGNVARLTPTVTNVAGAYTTGQCVGGLLTLTGAGRVAGGTGLMTSARLETKISNSAGVQFDLLIFSSQPSGTYTDNTTFTINAADLAKLSKVYHITDWTQLGASASHGQSPSEARFYQCADGTATTSLWAILVIRGSLTFSTTSDLYLSIACARN